MNGVIDNLQDQATHLGKENRGLKLWMDKVLEACKKSGMGTDCFSWQFIDSQAEQIRHANERLDQITDACLAWGMSVDGDPLEWLQEQVECVETSGLVLHNCVVQINVN